LLPFNLAERRKKTGIVWEEKGRRGSAAGSSNIIAETLGGGRGEHAEFLASCRKRKERKEEGKTAKRKGTQYLSRLLALIGVRQEEGKKNCGRSRGRRSVERESPSSFSQRCAKEGGGEDKSDRREDMAREGKRDASLSLQLEKKKKESSRAG